ncbi:MAG: hypothetical protein V4591_10705 [Bdellovibrionota bacterium]
MIHPINEQATQAAASYLAPPRQQLPSFNEIAKITDQPLATLSVSSEPVKWKSRGFLRESPA